MLKSLTSAPGHRVPACCSHEAATLLLWSAGKLLQNSSGSVPPARSRSSSRTEPRVQQPAMGSGSLPAPGDNSRLAPSAGRAGTGERGRAPCADRQPRYLLGAGDPRDSTAHHSEAAPRGTARLLHSPSTAWAAAPPTASGSAQTSSVPAGRLHLRRAAAPKLPLLPRGGAGQELSSRHPTDRAFW